MLRPRYTDTSTPSRPGWLTHGVINLAVLCLLIVLVGMLSPRLSRTDAGITFFVGLGLFLVGVAFFVGGTRRMASRITTHAAADAVLLNLRRIGLPLLGLGFFLAWTVVYVGLWWVHPLEAFRGLGPSPRFADFFYYAVSTAFISPPGDIVAHSRGARSATMIEMLTGFALLAAYLSSFVDWRPSAPAPPEQPPAAP